MAGFYLDNRPDSPARDAPANVKVAGQGAYTLTRTRAADLQEHASGRASCDRRAAENSASGRKTRMIVKRVWVPGRPTRTLTAHAANGVIIVGI